MQEFIVAIIVAAAAFGIIRRLRRELGSTCKADAPASPACGGCCGCGSPAARRKLLLLIALTASAAPRASAADTVESWDVGATNAEFYLGLSGFGPDSMERELSNEILLGYGITESFSAYVGGCVVSSEQLVARDSDFCFGLMGTPRDGDRIDVDLMLGFEAAGGAPSGLRIAPAAEINFDADPGMQTWGLYLRAGLLAHGEAEHADDGAVHERRMADLELQPGAYLRVSPRHQLLVEYHHARPVDRRGSRVAERAVALGWNLLLSERIEAITQLQFDLPGEEGPAAVGFAFGFVATLPGGR